MAESCAVRQQQPESHQGLNELADRAAPSAAVKCSEAHGCGATDVISQVYKHHMGLHSSLFTGRNTILALLVPPIMKERRPSLCPFASTPLFVWYKKHSTEIKLQTKTLPIIYII